MTPALDRCILIVVVVAMSATKADAQKIDSIKFGANVNSIIQFYEFARAIQRNEETAALYMAVTEQDWKENRNIIQMCIGEEKTLKKHIDSAVVAPRYTTYKKQLLSLMDIIIKCFNDLYNYGPESEQFLASNKIYQPKLNAHLDTLTTNFDGEHYTTIDSAQYCKYRDEQCDQPFAGKAEAKRLLSAGNVRAAYDLVMHNSGNLTNDAALMFLSDMLLKRKYRDSVNIENQDSVALAYLQQVMHSGHYAPYLFEAWRKWRVTTQGYLHGSSKSSDIPNDEYDGERVRLLQLMRDHIKKHGADGWAYIQFFSLNEIEIIHRFGAYRFGHQGVVEAAYLFD